MALDMANSDVSSATVRVLISFYLVTTEDTKPYITESTKPYITEPRRSTNLREIQCSAKRRRTQQPVQLCDARHHLHWVSKNR